MTAEAVAARLQRLAADGATGTDTGTGTLDGVLAAVHRRRRTGRRWAAAAVAVVVLGTVTSLSRPDGRVSAAEAAPVAASTVATAATSRPPAIYEQPARGSLAGDQGFLDAAAELPWSPIYDSGSMTLEITPGTRRAVYAGDVPGGHRWVVVLADAGSAWALDWFIGPRGAAPDELEEVTVPTVLQPWRPVGLLDTSEATGPLLLLDEPGATAEYSPSLDRAPDGTLGRFFTPVPVVDGVPLGTVTTPVTWGAGELHSLRDGVSRIVSDVLVTGSPGSFDDSDVTTPLPDDAAVVACLNELGFVAELGGPGDDYSLSVSDPMTGELSSAEQAARDAQNYGCFRRGTHD